MWIPLAFVVLSCFQDAPTVSDALPELIVEADDVRIERSCRVVIPPGTVITDANGDGVLHIVADGVRVEFAPGSVLRGALSDTAPDQLVGVGIRLDGVSDVELVGARVHGFRVGVLATAADGLRIDGADVSDNFAQRLRSTRAREDAADWLRPHGNDTEPWHVRYGAGIVVEKSQGVVVRSSRARRTQNGLILDRCLNAEVYDNDFSFLSGWGVALWRTSDSVVSRNALDFCVRGYSHGVYNRGQDSAGLLMFEQCSRNLIAENSLTHGGDGIFGFAGEEALGQATGISDDFEHTRAGCNDNLFIGNDLSYAPAHGLELTFSFGNVVRGNRFHENAITGVWGGYSREFVVEGNEFHANGDHGYGLERGGVNCEHAQDLWIVDNDFTQNTAAVHLWWDEDAGLAGLPWVLANGHEARDAWIVGNRFTKDTVALHLRACEDTRLFGNTFTDVSEEVRADSATVVRLDAAPERPATLLPTREPLGEARPVGARAALRGRQNIVLTEWGPWDHRAPLLHRVALEASGHRWELLGAPPEARVRLVGEGVTHEREVAPSGVLTIVVRSTQPGVRPYTLAVDSAGQRRLGRGTLVVAEWDVTVFPSPTDPRTDEVAWRAGADGPGALRTKRVGSLVLDYQGGGLVLEPAAEGDEPRPDAPRDHFGTLARTRIELPLGRWRVRTLSDDGVRVRVDGAIVLEDWTQHGPRHSEAIFDVDVPRVVEIAVEHFELTGHAVLAVLLEPAAGP